MNCSCCLQHLNFETRVVIGQCLSYFFYLFQLLAECCLEERPPQLLKIDLTSMNCCLVRCYSLRFLQLCLELYAWKIHGDPVRSHFVIVFRLHFDCLYFCFDGEKCHWFLGNLLYYCPNKALVANTKSNFMEYFCYY